MLFLAQDVMSTDGTERVTYYISRILNDSKTRYTYIEKLCMSLFYECTKLEYYLLGLFSPMVP
jgi:hypothetical protein